MKKWITIISLITIIGFAFYIFTEAKHLDTGYIISVTDNNIWLVRDSEENIQGKTEKDLREIYKFKGTFYDTTRIPTFTKERLQVGQKLRVLSDGISDKSSPSQNEATFIFISAS